VIHLISKNRENFPSKKMQQIHHNIIINESVRNEDLSIIDDEMTIHNQINKDFKPRYNNGPAKQLHLITNS
jgi:hypothetical protein